MADFLETLHSEHEVVKELFEKIQGASTDAAKGRLFDELKRDLDPHMRGEEKYFYPALEAMEKYKKDALEAVEEHHAARLVLKEVEKMAPDDEHWDAKVSVLKEMIDHHIEEEEDKIFKHAREGLSDKKLAEIGESFQSEKARAPARSGTSRQ